MAPKGTELEALLQRPFDVPVYYFASTEEPLIRRQAGKVLRALENAGEDSEVTRIDGPAPPLGNVVDAAGTISFFSTRRIVELRGISPSSMNDKDVTELSALFGELENAVLVVTALYKDKKAAASKKAKALYGAAAKAGYAAELAKPARRDTIAYIQQIAAEAGSGFAPGAAEALVEYAGEEWELLKSETDKLAAISGYREITREQVEKYATHNVEADVFQLARYITGRRRADAFLKLEELLALRHEPIAISAALAGSFVDMYRVRCGTAAKRRVGEIFTELGYRGNDYRLKKAGETAARYSLRQLEDSVLCLASLDRELKSSALQDKSILLEAAIGNLMEIGEKR